LGNMAARKMGIASSDKCWPSSLRLTLPFWCTHRSSLRLSLTMSFGAASPGASPFCQIPEGGEWDRCLTPTIYLP
jgi:hypothetical protein